MESKLVVALHDYKANPNSPGGFDELSLIKGKFKSTNLKRNLWITDLMLTSGYCPQGLFSEGDRSV